MPGGVTGMVFNSTGQFSAAPFLFVSEDGSVSGWPGPGTAVNNLKPASPDDVYKGAAIATVSANGYLYAASFKAGTIDVVKGTAGLPICPDCSPPTPARPALPAEVQSVQHREPRRRAFVTYALANPATRDDTAGAGERLRRCFRPERQLPSPHRLSGTVELAVGAGDRSDVIQRTCGSAFGRQFRRQRGSYLRSSSGASLGFLTDLGGNPIRDRGLWDITPGNGGNGGSRSIFQRDRPTRRMGCSGDRGGS